jgi:hypothetical protein
MSTYRTFYSDNFTEDVIGQITGSIAVSAFPSVTGKLFRLKARSNNIGSFLLGTNTSNVVFELDAGDDTGWFMLGGDNLNQLYFSDSSGSSERLSYWAQK